MLNLWKIQRPSLWNVFPIFLFFNIRNSDEAFRRLRALLIFYSIYAALLGGAFLYYAAYSSDVRLQSLLLAILTLLASIMAINALCDILQHQQCSEYAIRSAAILLIIIVVVTITFFWIGADRFDRDHASGGPPAGVVVWLFLVFRFLTQCRHFVENA
jgi:hypothetical protein